MQVLALNEKEEPVLADRANKQQNYFCAECSSLVRLKQGNVRQAHFYHLYKTSRCRSSTKGEVHIALQKHLLNLFPNGEAKQELRFKEIGRVADLVWLPKKWVFEIQYSPIYAEEVAARNRDYNSLGYEVIWVLHEKQFNKDRLKAAEEHLRCSTHYFTNFNRFGKGIIYDQFSLINSGVRVLRLPRLPVNLACPKANDQEMILKSRERWKVSFSGDLINLASDNPYLKRAQELEATCHSTANFKNLILGFLKKLFKLYVDFLDSVLSEK